LTLIAIFQLSLSLLKSYCWHKISSIYFTISNQFVFHIVVI